MSLGEALRRPELGEGAAWAALLGVPVAVAALAGRVVRGRSSGWPVVGPVLRGRSAGWPVAGVLVTVASLLALAAGGWVGGRTLVGGVALLGLAGLVPLPWRAPALVPGAVVVASQVPDVVPWWARGLVVAACLLAGTCGPPVEARHRPGVGPALFAGSAIGAWACVPDVELVAVVAGAAALTGGLSLAVPLRLGAGGTAAASGLLLWAAAWGALGRPAALIGAAASLGLLVVGIAGLPASPTVGAGAAAVAGQAALVAITSRVAGIGASVPRAATISAAALIVAAAAAALVAHRPPPVGTTDGAGGGG